MYSDPPQQDDVQQSFFLAETLKVSDRRGAFGSRVTDARGLIGEALNFADDLSISFAEHD